MGLRDILRKKEDLEEGTPANAETMSQLGGGGAAAPEFKLIRCDTHNQEVMQAPYDAATGVSSSGGGGGGGGGFLSAEEPSSSRKNRHSLDVFSSSRSSRSRSASASSNMSSVSARSKRRLSERLHLTRAPSSSEHVPQDLPDIGTDAGEGEGEGEGEGGGGGKAGSKYGRGAEYEWEKRATLLAGANMASSGVAGSRSLTPSAEDLGRLTLSASGSADASGSRSRSPSVGGPVSSEALDRDIQEAIRLHEEGDLERSTALFGRLADPQGPNNPLSQVLYGLALRHGWGCEPDVSAAVKYLTSAASNAASVEQTALQAGLKKGGAAKGELVLAIFELGNSFRHGWGTNKDPYAAKQYYETAANLGDTDAMNETAWCYLEGFGCKKDKFTAARYYRLAETNGNKTLGNSWIWKEKYDPGAGGKKNKR